MRSWLSDLRGRHGYGYLSMYDAMDAPALPSPDEWDGAGPVDHTPLMDRWARELQALPVGGPVPAERAWRLSREFHDFDHFTYGALLQNLSFFRPLARAHGCYMPLVSLVRDPHAYYVSHITFMVGMYTMYDPQRPATTDLELNSMRSIQGRARLSLENYVAVLPNAQSRWLTAWNYRSRQHQHAKKGKLSDMSASELRGWVAQVHTCACVLVCS